MIFLTVAGAVLLAELALTVALSMLRRAKGDLAQVHEALCRAPLLDLLVGAMTLGPPVVGVLVGSWGGLAGAIVGQVVALHVWVIGHELVHREAARGPRLLKAQNGAVGPLRNHLALWTSVLVVPVFWGIRLGEVVVYPPLCWIIGFPKYRHAEWVNVSRHKFDGLIGHDLIWCLYCDWMTGVYSLGAEMLRNIESFWCPIRFYDGKKCENCRVDFPDVDRWAVPDGSVEPAVRLFEELYADNRREWFGHPAHLTVEGSTPGDAKAHGRRR